MNKYSELKDRHAKLINEFPMFFAFSENQLHEGMKKLGLEITQKDQLLSIGMGGYIKKVDEQSLEDLHDSMVAEFKNAMDNDEFLFDAIKYELGNHEYCITYSVKDALAELGLTLEEVKKDHRLNQIFLKAKKEYSEEWES